MSTHWEEQLAKKLFQQYKDGYDSEHQLLELSCEAYRRVRRVFDRIVPHSGLSEADWDVIVFNTDDHDAYVLPGGKVFISTGMIDFCKSDDELASILAHEIAHTACHHSAEGISRNLIWIPAFMISWLATGMDPDLVEIAVNVAYRLPGSRAQEREADYYGLLMMAESGYDASACWNLWSRWEDFDKDESPSYLSTHPTHRDRTRSVLSWLKAARGQKLSYHSTGQLLRPCKE